MMTDSRSFSLHDNFARLRCHSACRVSLSSISLLIEPILKRFPGSVKLMMHGQLGYFTVGNGSGFAQCKNTGEIFCPPDTERDDGQVVGAYNL